MTQRDKEKWGRTWKTNMYERERHCLRHGTREGGKKDSVTEESFLPYLLDTHKWKEESRSTSRTASLGGGVEL